jgi:hypothetical protein
LRCRHGQVGWRDPRPEGEDGNAFAIIGRVSKALKRAGLEKEAEEFKQKAMACPSYDALLMLVLEYVEDGDQEIMGE